MRVRGQNSSKSLGKTGVWIILGRYKLARIVVIGAASRDEVITLTEPLQSGAHLNGVEADARLGGGGANTAVALTAAGHEVILLTAVGRDAIGDLLIIELAAAGVSTTSIVRLDQPTTRSLVLVEPTGERTVINVARCEEIVPPKQLLNLRADAVYVRSRRRDLASLLAAKARDTLIVAHAPPVEAGVRPAHVVIASRSDIEPPTLQAPYMLGWDISNGLARWTVITAGAAGASVYGAHETMTVAARSVRPIDTTGAGDAFAAGLIHALVQGRPMMEALAVAVWFGTEAVLWPTSGIPASAIHRLLQRL